MHALEAVEYVNSLAKRPGWDVWARQVGPWSIDLAATFDTIESDGADAPHYSQKFRRVVLPVTVDVRTLDADELTRIVLEFVVTAEQHEWREYLRTQDEYSGAWVAPLHPHTRTGAYQWAATSQAAKRFHASHPDYEG